jgi:DNA ligase-1
LEFLLNTDKKTGISTAKLSKEVSSKVSFVTINDFKMLINYVLMHNTGTDDVVRTVQHFIEQLPNLTLQTFVSEIITKKYKCGVTAKVAAEILPDIIKKEHQVMLANKFKGELKEPVQVSLKLDGIRCSALIDDDIKFLSRQGKEIIGLNQIKSALESMNLKGYMLDGELIRINHDNLPSEENFKLTTSIVSSKEEDKQGLEYVIFDIVPLEDYKKRECKLIFAKRKKMIKELIKENDFVRMVPVYVNTNSTEQISEILHEVEQQGQEGLMLNTLTGLYSFGKRSNDLLKVKTFNTCDIFCTGVEEGTGKYAGTLGAIICDYKGYKLKVGSGISDELRDYFWNHKSKIVNRIVEVKYFEESSDKDGNLSLRFPVFVQVRDDKDDPSYE